MSEQFSQPDPRQNLIKSENLISSIQNRVTGLAANETTPATPSLDKARLNRIHQECFDPKKVFGRDIVLSNEDLIAIEQAIDVAKQLVEKATNEIPQWSEFQQKVKDSIRDSGFPPKVFDGGDQCQIQVHSPWDGPDEVTVPTPVRQAYEWHQVLKELCAYLVLARCNDGNSAQPLSKNLGKIAHLLHKNRLL